MSSDAQADSLPEQRRWAKQEAASLGIEIRREFQGVGSGKLGRRKLLSDLIDALKMTPKAERPIYVLMVRLDRIGREPLDSLSAINELRRLGITIRTRTDGDVKLARVIEQVPAVFAALQAGLENEVRSDRAKAGHARRRAAGLPLGTKLPYGAKRGPDGHLVPDPERAPSVIQAANLYLECRNWTRVASFLEGAPPRARSPRRKDPGPVQTRWYAATARRLLSNPALRGTILPEALWDQVHAAIGSRPFIQHRYRVHTYPLSGILCPCGRPLWGSPGIGYSKGKNGKRYPLKHHYHYYVCRAPSHGRQVSWRDDVMEDAWKRFLDRLTIDARKIARELDLRSGDAKKERSRIGVIDARLGQLEQRKARAYEGYEDGTYDGPTLKTRIQAIDQETAGLQAERARLMGAVARVTERHAQASSIQEAIRDAVEDYPDGDPEAQRGIFLALNQLLGPLRLVASDPPKIIPSA